MNRILVVNVNWLGDVIFSSPVFRALKQAYPQAKISCLAVPRVKEILESIPEIDEVIVYDEEGRHQRPWMKFKLIMELRKKKFDVAFLLHRSWTRAFLIFLTGIKQRIGYDTKERGVFLTHRVKSISDSCHRSDYYLQVIESFGIKVSNRTTQLSVDPDAQEQLDQLLEIDEIKREESVIVVNPGGNWDLKRWPQENFTLLIEALAKENDKKIVIPGAEKDAALVRSIVKNLSKKPIILTGKLTLKQLIALMKRAHCVISADSGPLHLANSVGTKAVALFGPTRPELTGPRGEGRVTILQNDVGCNRQACYYLQCPDNVCMKSISVDDVLKAIRQI